MEQFKELLKNKKFIIIFSSFIGLIGLIVIFRRKSPESGDNKENDINSLKLEQDNIKRDLKLIKKKNLELEAKSYGKSITGKDSKRVASKIDDTGKEGKGKTGGDDENNESDDSEDLSNESDK